MENILIGTAYTSGSNKIEDLVPGGGSALTNGQITILDSDGNQVSSNGTNNGNGWLRNTHFTFVMGNTIGQGSLLNGIHLNPFDFRYNITNYVAPTKLVKKITVSIPTQAQFDAASQNCCNYHPYRFKEVSVYVSWDDFAHVYGSKTIKPVIASSQIGYVYNPTAVINDIVEQLQHQLEPYGFVVTLANGNEITITAPNNVTFNLRGEGIAEDSVVVTVTPMVLEIGGADLTLDNEIWDAVKIGYNNRFERDIPGRGAAWKEAWKTSPTGTYSTMIIESKTDYQYELRSNENKGLWVKQIIVAPSASNFLNNIATTLDGIAAKAGAALLKADDTINNY